MQITPKVLKEIYASDKPINIKQTLAGEKYLTTCSSIKSFDNEAIGVLLTGIPEKEIAETQQLMLSHGIDTKQSVQKWLMGIGVIALCLFFGISLFLATNIVRSIQPVIVGIT